MSRKKPEPFEWRVDGPLGPEGALEEDHLADGPVAEVPLAVAADDVHESLDALEALDARQGEVGAELAVLGGPADGQQRLLDVVLEGQEVVGLLHAHPDHTWLAGRGKDSQPLDADHVMGMALGHGPQGLDDSRALVVVGLAEEFQRQMNIFRIDPLDSSSGLFQIKNYFCQ